MENLFFVAYYRVSTRRQGDSGLSLDAQKATVLSFIKTNGNKIIGEFTEIESGKHDKRPELQKAIDMAKQHDATLIISKLDRLSRNLTFISLLMDNKVRFKCCDMLDANELTISIFASLAQWERKRISERIKEAVAQKRLREPDWKPGHPSNLTAKAIEKSRAVRSLEARENQSNRHAFHYIESLRSQGVSFDKIAKQLNAEGYKTSRGGVFRAMSVYKLYKRFTEI